MRRTVSRLFIGALSVTMATLLTVPAVADDRGTCADASGDEAIAACTRAITSGRYRGNDLARLFINRGVEWVKKDEHVIAIDDFNQAIRLNPNYATAFYLRGNAFDSKGQYDAAIEDYTQAIRLDPTKGGYSVVGGVFLNRGGAYSSKGQSDRAIDDFNQAIRLNPSFSAAYYMRG